VEGTRRCLPVPVFICRDRGKREEPVTELLPRTEILSHFFFQNVKQRRQLRYNGVIYDPLCGNLPVGLHMTTTIQKI
jgi:hypothetical protein